MSDSASQKTSPILSNGIYDTLKWVAQILLPGVGALYFGLAGIWGLPNAEQIVGTIAIIDTFLGLLLGLSSAQYTRSDARFDGAIHVVETEETKQFSLELHSDPATLDQKQEVLFKVDTEPER